MSQYISENNKIILYLTQELEEEEQEKIANKMSKDVKFRNRVQKMAQIISDTKNAHATPANSITERIFSYLKCKKIIKKRKSVEDQSHADQTRTY